ncbi:MAG: CoA-binding protein [Bacteroidetes bacterium]|nr:CoA-binding protein [Bacteroidota bacterium]
MTKKGFTVYPVNPNAEKAEGVKCYPGATDLPDEVTAILIAVSKSQSAKVVGDAVGRGIRHIWIQQMSDTPEALETGKAEGINLIYRQCIMMFAPPVQGIHKFHRGIKGFFGRLHK